jgi:DNA adenine methylase
VNDMAKPFLKWPGGKRWLTPYVYNLLKERTFNRYFEPFLGAGAVFFSLQPKAATLSDVNADLVNTYHQVKERPLELIEKLKEIPIDKETYLTLRETSPINQVDRAVRFLYLNRTAFGGMYRLDREGHFNVPFGGGQRTQEPLWRDNLLVNASEVLKSAEIIVSDFEETLTDTGNGDLVYCDPTYTVTHNNNGFIRYNERNFSWSDQIRLARVCRVAATKGATVLVSNAYHHEILGLYSHAEVHVLERKSLLCPNSSKRQAVQEYLFVL